MLSFYTNHNHYRRIAKPAKVDMGRLLSRSVLMEVIEYFTEQGGLAQGGNLQNRGMGGGGLETIILFLVLLIHVHFFYQHIVLIKTFYGAAFFPLKILKRVFHSGATNFHDSKPQRNLSRNFLQKDFIFQLSNHVGMVLMSLYFYIVADMSNVKFNKAFAKIKNHTLCMCQ